MLRRVFLRSIPVTAFVLTVSMASAATVTLDHGRTTVTLDAGFVAALKGLGLSVGVIEPSMARLERGTVSFPVVAGAIDLMTAKGEIIHSGGLTLSAGSTTVALQSFTIDTTGASGGLVLTGLVTVNGVLQGRLPLFNVQLPAGFAPPLKAPGGVLRLSGVGLKLTGAAAAVLNGVFKTNALPTNGSLVIGVADVLAFVGEEHEQEDR